MTVSDVEAVKLLMLSILQRQSSVELRELPDDLDLLAEGVLDSLGFVELVAELETQLGRAIDLSEHDPDQLARVGPLSRYIATQAGASRA